MLTSWETDNFTIPCFYPTLLYSMCLHFFSAFKRLFPVNRMSPQVTFNGLVWFYLNPKLSNILYLSDFHHCDRITEINNLRKERLLLQACSNAETFWQTEEPGGEPGGGKLLTGSREGEKAREEGHWEQNRPTLHSRLPHLLPPVVSHIWMRPVSCELTTSVQLEPAWCNHSAKTPPLATNPQHRELWRGILGPVLTQSELHPHLPP